LLGEILVVAQDEHGALARRDPLQLCPQLFIPFDIGEGVARPILTSARAGQVRTLDPTPPERPVRQGHYRSPQIRVERFRVPKIGEAPDQLDEGVLDEVLGVVSVTRQ
jgi:hypothetical protein